MKFIYYILLISTIILSCKGEKRSVDTQSLINPNSPDTLLLSQKPIVPDTIIDSDYSFEEAIAGSNAPEEIIEQLELIDVVYISTDGKIHKGQILTNRLIAEDIREIFSFMLNESFVIEKAVPITRYNWSDSLSMEENNSYSFCYRNMSYSKHAYGMAIDINPRFNPLRWKIEDKPNQPVGAELDTTVNGTLFPGHPVVDQFKKLGFRWGHSFTKYYDDHHFEKAQFSLSKLR
jgi:hypothetical protein